MVAEPTLLKPGILRFPRFFLDDESQHLIGVCENRGKWVQAPIGGYKNNTLVDSKIDKTLRDVEVCDLQTMGIEVMGFRNAASLSTALKNFFDLDDFAMSRAMICRYSRFSHIRPHRDTETYSTTRLMTCVAYLNSEYSGGQIDFPDFSLKHSPASGECLCFYSEYLHGVEEITGGRRYAIVWFAESTTVPNMLI